MEKNWISSQILTAHLPQPGLDLSRVDMVIFLQPFNQEAGLLQGVGRGGRKQ
jgi:ERCC4-related helicase